MAAKALSFDVGDFVVYPKHGVGRVVELQSTEIAGTSLDLYVLRFEKERMTLRVPVGKADSVGMRKLSSDKTMKDALETLKVKFADFAIITRSKSFSRPIDARDEFEAAGQALLAALMPVPKGIRLLGLGLHNLAEPAEGEPMQLGLEIY